MQPQSNTYRVIDSLTMELTIGAKEPIVVTFDRVYYDDIKHFHWAYRGKGIIRNDYNDTLGSYLAELYGYEAGTWTRNTANGDYTSTNYRANDAPVATALTDPAVVEKAKVARWAKRQPKPIDPMGVPFHNRIRYTNKNEVVYVECNVAHSYDKVKIYTNKFVVQYIPTLIRMEEGVPTCMDGTKLKIHLLEKLGADEDVRSRPTLTRLDNELDLRIDPNDITLVANKRDRIRYHYFTDDEDEEYVVVEVRNEAEFTKYSWTPDSVLWRLPNTTYTRYEPRVAYVVLDVDVVEELDSIWLDSVSGDWYCRESNPKEFTKHNLAKPRQVKRVVAERMGLQIDNIYIQPRYNANYARAMECTADLTTAEGRRAARIRARYENRASSDAGQRMFKPPKLIKRRKVIADKTYFCPYIYGGVGVWCMDLRKDAIRLHGIQAPEQDNSIERKDDILTALRDLRESKTH